MDPDRVIITIENDEMWEQRRARLKALESVNQPHTQEELNCRAYPRLHAAMKEGDIEKFIEALEKCPDEERVSLSDIFHIRGPTGNSLLHVAAGIEKSVILRALLDVIHDKQLATQTNDRGDTPLHIAARADQFHTAKLLLECSSIVDEENEAGNTALHEAVKNNNCEMADLLLCRGSKSVNKKNKENKCPLYLAVEMGNSTILSRLLQAVDGNEVLPHWMQIMHGMSPVHGAVIHQKLDMLKEISEKKKELFDLRDAGWGTPLHLAAHENYIDGVKVLVDKFFSSALKGDKEGYLPIHVACKMGHLETIKELLRHWPDPEELLTLKEWQNILHVAARYGRASVVKYILHDPRLEKLINVKDKAGNTPLHVATLQWQPEVLFSLTRDKRVNRELVNNKNLTALDIVDKRLKNINAPLHKRLTRTILVSAGTPRSKDKAILKPRRLSSWRGPSDLYELKEQTNARMVVATLIAAVTFAAGFSVPGGYNDSKSDAGFAMLLHKPIYNVFVICNSIAMFNSIITVVILLWTQVNDSHMVLRALRMARLPLLIALATMSMAFLAGVYVTISKRTWITVVALIVGITALFIILFLYIALFVPLGSSCRLGQLFADHIIRAAILITRRVTKEEAFDENRFSGIHYCSAH